MGRPSGNKRRSKQRSIRNRRKNLASKAARTARRNARLNAKRGTDRTGKLKINVSARRAAKHLANTRVARALGLTGIGNRIANRVPKNWKVNANLKTAIKSKIGEKNYRRTSANNPGSGGGLTDQQLADYDFYSKYNPQGITVSQAKKMYANQLREGISLKDAMASNPSETGYFEALIPDREEPAKNIAASTKKQLRSIRSATPGGLGNPAAEPLENMGREQVNFGKGGTKNWLDFYRPENQDRLRKESQDRLRKERQEQESRFEQDSREYDAGIVAGGIPTRPKPLPRKPTIEAPKMDWLGDFYRTHNIGGKGGKLDDAARDYWTNEAKTRGRRATMDIIRGTAMDQGTWGGMSGRRRGKQPRNIARPLPWKGKGRAKPTGRGFLPTIAATMAARGF